MSSSNPEQEPEEETGAAASLPSVEEQMQAVLELVDARAAGRATNAQVEAAVARLLELQASVAPPPAGGAAGRAAARTTAVPQQQAASAAVSTTTVESKDPPAAAVPAEEESTTTGACPSTTAATGDSTRHGKLR